MFCAIITLVKHTIEDVVSSSNNTTLILHPLFSDSAFIKVGDNISASLEGYYLYFHGVKSKWIRSGKVCGSMSSATHRNFGTRKLEHEKGANGTPVLQFHYLYPEYQNTDVPPVRKWDFHHLHQYVGIGFEQLETSSISALGTHGKLSV